MVEVTIERIKAAVRQVMREEFENKGIKPLWEIWAPEEEVLKAWGKSRVTLYRAIAANRFDPKDIRSNPIGKGYLFRRSAFL
ncbi:hypothetical protein [Spirosoma sp. 48-14]|uniref:hypothetical protein n=1 Tax=Spirosoma sp. 48-14 TaxID=1895854 RepID=UPI000959BD7E|nr:hypothetical protein [Spirosoma sp. 48-14]OJW74274.1 MAG: hypothetical protein BGO59_14260 [Spirosoma sp. 48-14]